MHRLHVFCWVMEMRAWYMVLTAQKSLKTWQGTLKETAAEVCWGNRSSSSYRWVTFHHINSHIHLWQRTRTCSSCVSQQIFVACRDVTMSDSGVTIIVRGKITILWFSRLSTLFYLWYTHTHTLICYYITNRYNYIIYNVSLSCFSVFSH